MHSTENVDDGYFGSGKLIKSSIKKHGRENHITQILQITESRELLSMIEQQVVNESLLSNPFCLNLKIGGEDTGFLGGKHTSEAKNKISRTHLGKNVSEETRLKIGKASKGRIASQATRQKLSIPKTEEQKLHLSLIRKGKKHTDVQKLRICMLIKKQLSLMVFNSKAYL
jgi:hypothetical protein